MAGFHSSSSPSFLTSKFASRLYLLLSLLPLTLAILAFVLQWRGGGLDNDRWITEDFPGNSGRVGSGHGCTDVLSRSRVASFPYYRDWGFGFGEKSDLRPKICITSSTAAGLEQILPWIYYHKGVKVIYRTTELEEQQAKSRIWSESWLSNFFYKPCNHELFVKQTLNMEMAIVMAREAGIDWIFHLDTDELIYPAGAREYSLRQLLSDVPENVDIVIFPNYESSVEQDDIKEPFSEVSMFKKNFDHLPKDTYFASYKEATRGNPNYFLTYGNGKSAARIQDHLRPNGAHRWHNYMKSPNELKLEEAAVLHYTYPKFSDLTSRRDRCGCKPTKEDVKRCFMLEFDRAAFIIASTATDEEMLHWYREHVVWTDRKLALKLLRKGILIRIHTPMAIIHTLRESGVFSSVISSALLNSSNIVESNDSSRIIWSRKIGEGVELQATTRKMLDFTESAFHTLAVPPLSPPSIDDCGLDK